MFFPQAVFIFINFTTQAGIQQFQLVRITFRNEDGGVILLTEKNCYCPNTAGPRETLSLTPPLGLKTTSRKRVGNPLKLKKERVLQLFPFFP